ncbi:MAG: ABC transporter permease [Acidobacteriota bacterium]|nr:ABC transporter permease [Acidobacteriota bacterium]
MRQVAQLGTDAVSSILIRPTRGWTSLQLGEVWRHRELLYFLMWRDVKVRYKQTALGVLWAILQPLMTMVVFTIFFDRLANVGSDGLPYPLFSFAGLLPWNFFAQAVGQSSASLVGSANLISKVYFPRLIIPVSSVLVGFLDFGVGCVFLLGMMAYYGVWPSIGTILLVPLFVLLAAGAALGVGLWLSALHVKYRDVRYVVPFFIQLWLFVTPVIYPASRVTGKLEAAGLPVWIYGLNPVAGAVEGFRWATVHSAAPPASIVLASVCVSLVLIVTGAFYFRRTERTFADIV